MPTANYERHDVDNAISALIFLRALYANTAAADAALAALTTGRTGFLALFDPATWPNVRFDIRDALRGWRNQIEQALDADLVANSAAATDTAINAATTVQGLIDIIKARINPNQDGTIYTGVQNRR